MKYKYDSFNSNNFHVHKLVFDRIRPGSKVLDIGCATGFFAQALLSKQCVTTGVDFDIQALKKAAKYCDKTYVCDLEKVTSLPVPKKSFDYILLMDVIEHLTKPDMLLGMLKDYLNVGGKIILSVPNIGHASIRWMLLLGKFDYTTTGIMDQTHVHFYTKASLEKRFKDNGFKNFEIVPTNGMSKVPFLYKITDRLPAIWQYKIASAWPTLFAYQFVAVISPN